ncbi:hypothetical protein NHN26_14840 [Rhodovulum tesquicola]|uniref:hypothetical protein n=1 Tax=Rhodovulum tesquicola TaxID=540254 RepID=UPI00209814BB|nr:hypothetical protein [Rhodovulum tesquicola]MCO8146498.1 hypothetical protein [Rhodovulum tesquicola]
MNSYPWDAWMPKLAANQHMTDVKIDRTKSTTMFSDALGFALLSDKKPNIELKTSNPTPLSSKMGWDLLGGKGEGNVELTTSEPYPLSARMGWKLLSERKYYAIAAHQQ